MDSEISRSVDIYKGITKIPSAVSASILPGINGNLLSIHSLWTAHDFVKFEKTVFSRDYLIEKSNLDVLSTGIITDVSSVQVQAFSKSGKKQAVLQEKKAPEEKIFLEIWNGSQKEITFDMTDRKEHGKINGKDLFGCFQWSSDEKYLLYCAEKKQAKCVSFFKDSEKKEENGTTVKGEEYLYREEWGEGYAGLHHSVLCIIEVKTGNIEVLLDSEISVGQALWGPNDESVIFVAWEELPYKLGIRFCMNRRSSICALNLKTKEIECITSSDNVCARSPCFTPDFKALVYLENEADGAHFKCAKLQKYDWKTKTLSTVVDIIDNPVGDEFPGIYASNLPSRCWSEDGKQIFFSSLWRSSIAIVCVNINDGNIKRIETGKDFGASLLLDVHNNLITAEVSSPNTEPCLILGHINENSRVVDWKFLDENTPVRHPDIKWNIAKLSPSVENKMYPNLDYEVLVVSPETKKNNPLIVIPHGGPHSCFPAAFSAKGTGFVKLGYVLCFVNYRGSIGFGENNVNSLPGNVGTQDVADVQDAALYVKNKCNFDIGDVFVYGGSHGGFLGAHLCGQYPEFYKAAVLLNPVIDISAMISLSDIPDWCWYEGGCGSKLDLSTVVHPDHLKTMWEKSPIKHAEKVRAPTLLLLGKKDLRVPMAQGIKYYHLLKARNVTVSVYHYDDNHSLAKTPFDGDTFLQSVLWLKKHSSS